MKEFSNKILTMAHVRFQW